MIGFLEFVNKKALSYEFAASIYDYSFSLINPINSSALAQHLLDFKHFLKISSA